MNAFDNFSRREAVLLYLDADYEIRREGEYVTCAVTGKPIPLDRLRYWSVDRQEAYVDAQTAFEAMRPYPPEKE